MNSEDQAELLKARVYAKAFAKQNTDSDGNILAKVWEAPEFKETFDYNMSYEKKKMLKYRLETIWRNSRMAKQLFQKVYYYPNLILDDEIELRKRFISESGTHDLRGSAINWTLAATYFPVMWLASSRVRGWGCVLGVSATWYLLYKQIHNVNDGILQSNLNSFASPLVEKYHIVDHHE
jgi:hypothetical protein